MDTILRSFPDYGKTPPEYVASLVQLIAEYPASVQAKLSDLRSGIPARCQFVPSVANICAMADQLLKAEADAADFRKRFAGRKVALVTGPRQKAMPFPRLWEAFADELHLVEGPGITFDTLDSAAKTLAHYGKDAARRVLGGDAPSKGANKSAPIDQYTDEDYSGGNQSA